MVSLRNFIDNSKNVGTLLGVMYSSQALRFSTLWPSFCETAYNKHVEPGLCLANQFPS